MAKKAKPPVSMDDSRLPDARRWGDLMRHASGLAGTFGRDRLMHTLVASLALIAVIWGRDPIPVLSFAALFMILMPVLRYLKLFD